MAQSRNKTVANSTELYSRKDIIGGNSGSPVVNRDGELVGLIFDEHQSLTSDYLYSDIRLRRQRAGVGIIEALSHLRSERRRIK